MRVKSVKLDSVVTSVATPNIAFTKYWGRRDESPNLPHNSTISMTLNETLRTTTSVVFSRSISRDALYINGEEQDPFTNEEIPTYIRKVLNIMRDMAGIDAKALVVSENSFPADVGLASSDSGAAALVVGLNELFETNFPKDMLAELETEYLRVLHAPYMAV